jgi:RimJ/RimL family protein N-acetyltransferase
MTAFGLPDLKAGRCVLPLTREGVWEGDLSAAGPQDAPTLSDWRYANRRWFFSEFPHDPKSTEAWVEAIRDDPDRLLLMVRAEDQPIGVVGLRRIDLGRGEAELDNVLRGRATPTHPGLMSLAVSSLVAWAVDELGIGRFYLQVFHDNPARAFYRRLGFVIVGDPVGLAFHGTTGSGCWKPTTHEPKRYLDQMELAIDPERMGPRTKGSR